MFLSIRLSKPWASPLKSSKNYRYAHVCSFELKKAEMGAVSILPNFYE
ncbi:hypothetical protein TREAZ_1380 [Leadbettera azotonutricia ZAS-9]|uniref:Uncharacterized protein n=1 Tax=Leadbettera azotonutricia (strain ATCC BAA-888 / DSM 13862 / ZAS-9) TaxID=545695 RepID=F5YFC4_LEAAZ|nr:hypothetical protein TREAZ_1380 [Leadbettera azotonutricia ZAS-9]